jgi:hypothetical protein
MEQRFISKKKEKKKGCSQILRKEVASLSAHSIAFFFKKNKWRRIPLTPTRKLAFFICLFKMILYPFPIRILRELSRASG